MQPARSLIPLAVGGGLLAAAALAGPLIATGAILAVALAAVIYALPVIGIGFVLATNTVLQVPGSEYVSGLPVSLTRVAFAITFVVWAVRSTVQRIPMTWSPQLPAIAAFVLVVILSGFVTPDPAEHRDAVVRYVQLALLVVLIANIAGESESALDWSCVALTGAMTASALLGVIEFLVPSLAVASDDPRVTRGVIGAVVDSYSIAGVDIKRVTGGFGDANWFGYALVAVLPVNLYLFWRFQTALSRFCILSMVLLQSIGIVLSLTRAAIVAAAVSVLWLIFRRRLPLAPLLGFVLVGAGLLAAWNPAGLERIYSVRYAQEGGSTPIRTHYLLGGAALIAERPFFGYGHSQFGANLVDWLRRQPFLPNYIIEYENYTLEREASGEEPFEFINPHNTVVQVWVEFGLFGMITFSLFIILLMNDLRLSRRYGQPHQVLLADCLVASSIGFLICSVFGALLLYKITWLLAGFAAALRRVAIVQAAATDAPKARA